ncbi:MAG: hypothetical protein Fur0037_28560 [Planctomycetota bacterium]
MTPFLPRPDGSHGGGAYLGSLCRRLAEHADLALATFVTPEEQALVREGPWSVARTLPHPGGPKPGARHALSMLWRCGVRRAPLLVEKHRHPAFPGLLAELRSEFEPDCALVELSVMAQYLPCLEGVPSILTDHEGGIPSRVVTGYGALADGYDRRSWRRYVRATYRRATRIQALTAEDARAIERVVGRSVDLRTPVVELPERRIPCELAPPRALFLGDYRHLPNPEAATRIVEEILPRILARLPQAELLLAGPNSEHVHHLAGRPGVRLTGFVPDLPFLLRKVRCLLAPIYSGGGFRVKVLTALGHGLPVVTNGLGAQGIGAPAEALASFESPVELAEASLRWLLSPGEAARASEAAHAWARQHVTPNAVAEAQLARIERLIGR